MESAYQELKAAQIYVDFLASPNGQIQQKILEEAVLSALPDSKESVILDAACGTGWLANNLKPRYPKTYACDSSSTLIAIGKSSYPAVEFSHADLLKKLPYPAGFFDAVVLNMAGPDISNLGVAIKNLTGKIKPGGKLIMTVPNPYYSFPAAVWKRSISDILMMRKPHLKINDQYFGKQTIVREFNGQKIASNFYTLDDYSSAAASAGLCAEKIKELKSQTDSPRFDLNYQLFRFPLILMMEFKK